MSSAGELRGCGSCGSAGTVGGHSPDHWVVRCRKHTTCTASFGYFETREAAIKAWNTRASDKFLEELEGRMEYIKKMATSSVVIAEAVTVITRIQRERR